MLGFAGAEQRSVCVCGPVVKCPRCSGLTPRPLTAMSLLQTVVPHAALCLQLLSVTPIWVSCILRGPLGCTEIIETLWIWLLGCVWSAVWEHTPVLSCSTSRCPSPSVLQSHNLSVGLLQHSVGSQFCFVPWFGITQFWFVPWCRLTWLWFVPQCRLTWLWFVPQDEGCWGTCIVWWCCCPYMLGMTLEGSNNSREDQWKCLAKGRCSKAEVLGPAPEVQPGLPTPRCLIQG